MLAIMVMGVAGIPFMASGFYVLQHLSDLL